jgi:hypothetical protein
MVLLLHIALGLLWNPGIQNTGIGKM